MTPTLLTLTSAFLLLTLLSGCASQKPSAPLACFKGSPACYSQGEVADENCLTCRATLI